MCYELFSIYFCGHYQSPIGQDIYCHKYAVSGFLCKPYGTLLKNWVVIRDQSGNKIECGDCIHGTRHALTQGETEYLISEKQLGSWEKYQSRLREKSRRDRHDRRLLERLEAEAQSTKRRDSNTSGLKGGNVGVSTMEGNEDSKSQSGSAERENDDIEESNVFTGLDGDETGRYASMAEWLEVQHARKSALGIRITDAVVMESVEFDETPLFAEGE